MADYYSRDGREPISFDLEVKLWHVKMYVAYAID